jgi:hypothetical protein
MAFKASLKKKQTFNLRCENVLVGLEIAMHDAVRVQVLNSKYSFGNVDACKVERQRSHVLDKSGAIAALDVLHDETQMFASFERAEHADHEWIVQEDHDVALGIDLFDLVAQHQVDLLNLLQRESPTSLLVPHQVNGAAREVAIN